MTDHPTAPVQDDDAEWHTLECERVHYVDRGKETILCDRLPSPVTLVVKLAKGTASRLSPTPETGLVEALMEYGTHKSGCRMRVAMGQSCICGWAEVSAKVKAAASESPLLSERPLRAGADHAPGSASRDGSEATTPLSNVLPDEV